MRITLALAALAAISIGLILSRDGEDEHPSDPPAPAPPPAPAAQAPPVQDQQPARKPARPKAFDLPRSPDAAGPGQINLIRNATSSFDPFLTDSSRAERRWIASTYWRIRGYEPFFSQAGALRWAGPAHLYEDLYAIYRDLPEHQPVLRDHPDWVLRDASGRPLFIPADCDGQTCTQYAADIGNQKFRNWWIAQAKANLAKGYRGLFIDDVNMQMQVSDGAGRDAVPIDPRTSSPLSGARWRRYLAAFTQQIAAALPPELEIVHNAQWWVDHRDPFVKSQIAAADLIELERGYSDEGLVAGDGRFGFERFMDHIDWLHSRGKSVILEPYGLDEAQLEFELASYYLTRTGDDAIASDYRAAPGDFAEAWKTDLGQPRGPREPWAGLWRRRFERGLVLVNGPGGKDRTVAVPPAHRSLGGEPVKSLALGPGSGAVLLRGRP
jgi:hypothetical protein